MQENRFAGTGDMDWANRLLLTGQGAAERAIAETARLRAKYMRDWSIVKRARFNAAKRFERKQNASVLAFAIAGVCGFLVPYCTLQFDQSLAPHTKKILDFTSQTAGMLLLIIGLIEQARDYPAHSRRFDQCGRDVNRALRRISILHSVETEELRDIVADYEKALEECGINHDDLDREIAQAEEDSRTEKEARAAEAHKRINRLRRRESFQIYSLYVVTCCAPIAIGIVMWFALAPDPITTGSLPDARPVSHEQAIDTQSRRYDLLDEAPRGLPTLSRP
jgi:SMODS and SLOG-associating 2TM effector domain family 5